MSELKNPFIIDGMNLLYRSYHGNEKLTNANGYPTGAIFGFFRTMLGLQNKFKQFEPVIVFDALPESAIHGDFQLNQSYAPPILTDISTRKEIYADYKANRSHMPEELTKQCIPLILLLHNLGYPIIVANGIVEGDDIIGTLTTQAKQRNLKVKVGSGDKDLLALVDELCTIHNFNDKKEYDADMVKEKLGVYPNKVAEYLALMGDNVDNIPGVPKCGPKTAVKWLETYNSLQGIIDHADEIKGVVGENLRASLTTLPRNLLLTTLKTDLPLSYEACVAKPERNYDVVKNIFETLEIKAFNSLIPTESTQRDITL